MHSMSEGRQAGMKPFFGSSDKKLYYMTVNPNAYCIAFKPEALLKRAQPLRPKENNNERFKEADHQCRRPCCR